MKTNLIIALTATIAFAIPAYWQPLYLITSVVFGLLSSAIIAVDSITPDIKQTNKLKKRLDQLDETLRKLKLSRLG